MNVIVARRGCLLPPMKRLSCARFAGKRSRGSKSAAGVAGGIRNPGLKTVQIIVTGV